MAIYKLNGKEVTEEEFNKQVFKAVEESPFFLDEIVSVSFSGENRSDEEILKTLLNPNLKGAELRDEWKETTVDMSKNKTGNIFDAVKWNNINPTPAQKEKIDKIKSYIYTSNKCNTFGEVLKVLKAESEEELEDILKRNMNIGAPDYAHKPATFSHTGGTVFEKMQDHPLLSDYLGNTSVEIKLIDFSKPNFSTTITTDWQDKEKEQSKSQALRQEDYPQPEDNKNKLRDILGKKHIEKSAKKETEGKLFYELDFKFIEQMAERMQSNKDNEKYEKWNWKKPMTPKGIEDLKQAMWRHIIEVMQGNYTDDGRIYGHLEAISNNAMMINYQLKNK